VAVSPGADRITIATALAGSPSAITTGAGSVWMADASDGTVSRIDPASRTPVEKIAVGGDPASIASGDGALWVANTVGATLLRIDPTTETVTQTIPLGGANPDAVACGGGRVWVGDSSNRTLYELNPSTDHVFRTIALDVSPSALTFAANALWVAGYDRATVLKIAPGSGRVTGHVHVGNGPGSLAFAAGALWVANSLDSTVSRIDPATLSVRATIPVGSGPSALAASPGSVWVANQYSDSVSRIDPRRDHAAGSVRVGGMPTSLTQSMGRLWVGVAASDASHRGGTLALLTTQSIASVDPAFYNNAANPQFTGLAYDSLVTFQHSSGTDGLRLVPDLALALPTPSDHGATYAFRLRPGIRYSDGQPLRAADFRRAIERLFRVGSPGSPIFAGIVGATRCAQRPGSCDLSRGIVADDAAGTVVFHLATPDPEFLFKLTENGYSAPIPPGVPDRETGARTPPGTGPYRIVGVTSDGVRFVRNPFFREWSHAAQPDGNPDTIVWRYAPSTQDAVTAIEHGRGDWLFGLIPLAQYRQLQLQSPAQLHSNPQFAVDFVHLNTHRAPFNDIRVRQALNYAIDRARIAQMYGGPSFATPTCQPLAPGLPGYRRYCPYTLHPAPSGKWTAPDVAKAKHLVSESGTRGERVDVWGMTDNNYIPRGVPAFVAGVLRALGYSVHVHLAPSASITQAMRGHFQLSVDGDWSAEYPDPSSYIPQFFSCNGGNGNGYYCDPRLDREMREASLLELTSAAKATAVWASIDHQLTNNAAWVPTENLPEVDLVSARLRNYQYSPVWGFLADQSWVQ
jgi:YVTN family beta-propeller protein